jgi:hypothetical protein
VLLLGGGRVRGSGSGGSGGVHVLHANGALAAVHELAAQVHLAALCAAIAVDAKPGVVHLAVLELVNRQQEGATAQRGKGRARGCKR